MFKYKNLQYIRKLNKMSQSQIAQLLDVDQRQYSRWETGITEIPVHKLKVLANYYGVTIDYLVED